MNLDGLADATLVVLGHGTTKNDGSAASVYQHAAELRRRGLFAGVREAFWKQEPRIKPVLAGVRSPRVFIVPLFISEGFFASEIIPRELGFPADLRLQTPGGRLTYCLPVGTHDRMLDILLARATEVVAAHPFPRAPKLSEITLFLAGHGTERSEQSRRAVEQQVERVRARNLYAEVQAVFLEENPRIADCHKLAGTRNLVVVPFFVSDGLHVVEDIPVLLGEPERVVQARRAAGQPTWRNPTERHGKLIWYSSAVGSAPQVADVILARVREAVESERGTPVSPGCGR